MKKITISDRLRYAFDNTMSRGPAGLIGWLAIITLAVIFFFSIIIMFLNLVPAGGDYPEDASALEVGWIILMRTIDSGTVADDSGGWGFRLLMLAVTFGGIFIFSTLIGILSAGIEAKLDDLQKGRSRVVELDHTVILGWTPQIFTIIRELIIANENRRSSAIVILGQRDKVEMEDEIRDKIGQTRNTRVVCRTGSPIEMNDLELINLDAARSIIILSPDEYDPDSGVIKTMLAITNNPDRREEPYHIVAEIHNQKNMEIAGMVGKDEVELLFGGDVVSRIMAQTCLQSGLSVVYMEILNFHGDEIYFHEEPELIGQNFGDILSAYEDSCVLGIQPKDGLPLINPPMNREIKPGDRVIAISEDDHTVVLSGISDHKVDVEKIAEPVEIKDKPENILIIGWNWRTPIVIDELHNYFADGSSVTVVADLDDYQSKMVREHSSVQRDTVTFTQGDTTDRAFLDTLEILQYEYVIIMCYSDTLTTQAADARTLVTLLHLREIEDAAGHNFSIVSEMLDIRNRELADVTRADDFVVSDSLISLILTQLSENKALSRVYNTLFDKKGSEIYLEPASNYVKVGEEVNFYTVVEAARRQNEIAIGYRVGRHKFNASKCYGVTVNPVKSHSFTYSINDKIIVLSER